MPILTSQRWLHYTELESYIREQLEQESQYSCFNIEKKCLNETDSYSSQSFAIQIKTQFDLISKGELILFTPIFEWLESLSYCYIESVKVKFLPDDLNAALFESSLILELKYSPCKHRNNH